jgi:hypothetical protein
METDFVDIRIISLEEEMTVESPENPPLRYVFLRLSQTPLPIWQSYFREQRNVSRHPHWRRAWIDRKYIVVECLPEEIETYHLNDLKHDIAQANLRCRKYLQGKAGPDRQRENLDEAARERLREMKSRLNFD